MRGVPTVFVGNDWCATGIVPSDHAAPAQLSSRQASQSAALQKVPSTISNTMSQIEMLMADGP